MFFVVIATKVQQEASATSSFMRKENLSSSHKECAQRLLISVDRGTQDVTHKVCDGQTVCNNIGKEYVVILWVF